MQSLASFTAPGTVDSEMVTVPLASFQGFVKKLAPCILQIFLLLLEREIPSMLDSCAIVRQNRCIVESVLESQFPE
jgi:hypothetical protein